MELGRQSGVDWKKLFAQRGFRFFFAGVFVSLCGSGMNFAGVTWYVLGRTNSTVQVSLLLILMTIPGLFVPLFGGVLIDRVDRRYLGMTLDIARGLVVAGIATLFFLHRAGLGSIYTMVILLGVGSAMYWSNINALVQEVISSGELVAANSAVLIAVQGGLAISGGLVGFIYDRAGIAGILAIDASSYFISAFCLYRLRRGYFAPHVTHRIDLPESLETPLAVAEETSMPPLIEPAFESGFIAEFREGIGYLRSHPNILALGITYACMIAGVISSNVLVVALTKDILHAGATGYGMMESGWAVGAVAGGFAAGFLVKRIRPARVLMTSLVTLAIGNALFPYAHWLAIATIMHGIFGACRALGGVLTQSAIMTAVPRRLMGRTQSTFAVLSTLMQIMMSFSLGWLAEYSGLPIAFALLGIIYAGAVAAAFRARSMAQAAAAVEAMPG